MDVEGMWALGHLAIDFIIIFMSLTLLLFICHCNQAVFTSLSTRFGHLQLGRIDTILGIRGWENHSLYPSRIDVTNKSEVIKLIGETLALTAKLQSPFSAQNISAKTNDL